MKNEIRMTNCRNRTFVIRHSFFILSLTFVIPVSGCFPKPNLANIALRKEVQSLEEKVKNLEVRDKANVAQIVSLEANRTIQTLPDERLQRLFTVSGLTFRNLTLGEDLDPATPGDEAFKICVAPIDQFGDEFKSAGSIRVELFDLALGEPRIGVWVLKTPETQKRWLSTPVIDGYVLSFTWQTVPTNAKLLVKATFSEELTGRSVEAQTNLTITPPGK